MSVTIGYKGGTIAEMDGAGTKTIKTAGTYCEGDIQVDYAPRSRSYELTLTKASGWVMLTALDEDVLEHINDPGLTVTLIRTAPYQYEFYATNFAFATNTPYCMAGKYPVYGVAARQSNETTSTNTHIYYPPAKTDTSESLGGWAFRISDGKYYFKSADGFIGSGTYRLVFQW